MSQQLRPNPPCLSRHCQKVTSLEQNWHLWAAGTVEAEDGRSPKGEKDDAVFKSGQVYVRGNALQQEGGGRER